MRTFAAIGCVLLLACTSSAQKPARLATAEFQAEMKGGHPQLIDVRTPEEFSKGHLEGAVNLDWLGDDFMVQAGKLDKARPVLLYCAAGGRSEEALEALRKAGFRDAHDLLGGYNGWKKAGLPTTAK